MKKFLAIVLMAVVLICPVFASAEASAEPADADVYVSVEVTREATCADKGLLTYTTSDGVVYQIETPTTGEHNYTVETVAPTCTEDGQAVYTCTVCGDTYTEVIPATGHSYVYQYDAQQAEDGSFVTYGTWACENCGAVVDATEGNAAYYYGDQAAAASDEIPAEEASSEAGEASAEAADPQTGKWVTIELICVLVLILELAIIMVSFGKKKSK